MRIKENLTGKRFSRLLVLSRDIDKIGLERGSFWNCVCDCGNTRSVSRHSLVNHGTQSCGCLQKEKAAACSLPNAGADKNYWLSKSKRRAAENGILFSLTDQQFYDICSRPCFYCGSEPTVKSHGYKRKSNDIYVANGIDRVDPTIGYVLENSISCCKICNFMKTDKTQEDFLNKVFQIADNIRKRYVPS